MSPARKQKMANFKLRAPAARRVVITGSFNSWNENGLPMKKNKNGLWKADVRLTPGTYEYRFIVDGQWWTDPSNRRTVANPYGTHNSIKVVRT